jgi:hypothetical protein
MSLRKRANIGPVSVARYATLGGVVTPAQQLMVVVPAGTGLEIEATLPIKDVGFVHEGKPVEVKVEAFTFTRYGLLHGTVTGLSQDAASPPDEAQREGHKEADASNEEQASDGGQPTYAAMVSLDRTSMRTENGDSALEAGMAVTAEIKTGRRHVTDYLLSPLARFKQEAMREIGPLFQPLADENKTFRTSKWNESVESSKYLARRTPGVVLRAVRLQHVLTSEDDNRSRSASRGAEALDVSVAKCTVA